MTAPGGMQGRWRTRAAAAAVSVACLLGIAGTGRAQSLPCDDGETAEACRVSANAAVTMPVRTAIIAAGGNPMPGTPSTLGMRTPGSPRWSIALRGGMAGVSLPDIDDPDGLDATLWGVHGDFGIGIFDGVTLAPTIGGFGSIDLLASAGVISMPEDDGFDLSSPLTWALGVRAGILRESFTAPGVSISAMYRGLPDVTMPTFSNTDQSVVSIRTLIGKRVLGVDVAGGIGYDRVTTNALVRDAGTPADVLSEGDITESRASYFGSVAYTTMILNIAAELGWQANGDAPAGSHADTRKGGLFGGISFRLGI